MGARAGDRGSIGLEGNTAESSQEALPDTRRVRVAKDVVDGLLDAELRRIQPEPDPRRASPKRGVQLLGVIVP